MQEDVIINKVANSGLITIDLEKFYPSGEFVAFDIKPYLFMELILKEKDFREALKNTDWTIYQNKNVCIICSADAVIPVWAYMLLSGYLQPVANNIFTSDTETAINQSIINELQKLNVEEYNGQRMVIKGCGDKKIGAAVYTEITKLLRPVAKSIMYGEPCSTVPVYKAKV